MAVIIGPIIASRRLALAALTALLVGGCSPGFHWDGMWVGHRNYPSKPGQDSSVAYTLATVNLNIKNGRYELFNGGIPSSGTIHSSSKGVSLQADMVMERKSPPHDDGALTSIGSDMIEFRGTGFDRNPLQLSRDRHGARQ